MMCVTVPRIFFAIERDGKFTSRAVVGVASMGKHGFAPPFKHPRTEIIDWLGGPDCVYHTHIHEKKFDWNKILESGDLNSMVEGSHVLVETDGVWFRIVEIHERGNPIAVDPVALVRKSDGTRWIRAAKEN